MAKKDHVQSIHDIACYLTAMIYGDPGKWVLKYRPPLLELEESTAAQLCI